MKHTGVLAGATAALALLAAGCATTPPPPKSAPPAPPVASSAPAASSPPPAAQAAQGSPRPQEASATVAITKDYYDKTLADVRALITTLNQVIADQDFDAWTGYLTPDYIATFSDPAKLAQLSTLNALERQNIKLQSLKDYFLYVVVPSRTDAEVDALDFVSKEHVRALTVINNVRYILYDLQMTNGTWKIGVSP